MILEAERIGSGQTKNTTAKITSQHGLLYARLVEQFGEELAQQYAHANQKALEHYRTLIAELDIDCAFTQCPAYLYSTLEEEPLVREAQAARRLGIEANFTRRTELPFFRSALRSALMDRRVSTPCTFCGQSLPIWKFTSIRPSNR